MRITTLLVPLTALALLLSGCVERQRGLTQSEREQLSQFISTEAPSPQHPLNVSFEDKIRLLGYDVSAPQITPGEPITITWHWKVERSLDNGWQLFTHIGDASGANRQNADGGGDIRSMYGPGQWQRGEYIRDQQEITIPADWNSNKAVFYVGLWRGDFRLRITEGGGDSQDNRYEALSLDVGAPNPAAARPTQPAQPQLRVRRATSAIQIDGQLTESAWNQATQTDAFVDTMSGGRAPVNAKARVLWDDENLYVAFEVDDRFLKSQFSSLDDELWTEDCVEIMIDPGGRGQNYFEMQVSPQGIVFDTRYDRRRVPAPKGHHTWNSGLQTSVNVRGTVNDDDQDQGYTAEIAIPWGAFNAGTPAYQRPAPGATWRMNLYVMDVQEDGGQRAAAWSPPRVGDFHVPNQFGRLIFEGANARPRVPARLPTAPAAARPQLNPALPHIQLNPDQVRPPDPRGRPVEEALTGNNDRPSGDEPMPERPPGVN